MHCYINTITAPLQSLETALSATLLTLSKHLNTVSTSLSSNPISTTCTSRLQTIVRAISTTILSLPLATSLLLAVILSFLSFLLLAYGLYFLARIYFGSDPVLLRVPPPSQVYNPYEDEQSDLFGDDDVRPQLVSENTPFAIKTIAPATEETIGWISAHTSDEVHELVEKARLAQAGWACSSFDQRRTVMRVLMAYFLYEQKAVCAISARDTGKTMLEASLGEIVPTLEKLRWVLAEGEQALTDDFRTTGPVTRHKTAKLEYMPLGVIAAIAPWNYPVHNFLNPVIAALFSGNAIVVKPSEHALWASLFTGRVVRRTLALCGHSAELVQIVAGGGEVGAALVASNVDKVFFTGSTRIGKMVAMAAAEKLLPVVLELGGKDPVVVCEDAELEHAASICLRGVFQNAGQNCIAMERVFVHENIMDSFCTMVLEGARSIRLGVDMGAMTMGDVAIAEIQELVDDAVKQGAKLLLGGKRGTVNGLGFYYEPTVLKGVNHKMRIAREEVFGPVLSLFEWKNDHELVKVINTSPFGLGSSIFTGSKARANWILSSLKVGMCNINDFATSYLCQSMPFGGTKESGSDRFAGIEGLRACCIAKATTRDRFPGVKTRLPQPLCYPTWPNAFEFSAEVNDLMFGRGVVSKLDNVRNLVGMLFRPRWRPRTTASG